jgi:hypothetical protein
VNETSATKFIGNHAQKTNSMKPETCLPNSDSPSSDIFTFHQSFWCIVFHLSAISIMHNDDEIAVAVLVGMKRGIAISVTAGGDSHTFPENHESWLSPGFGSYGTNRRQRRLQFSKDLSEPQPLRKKTVSKVKAARCFDAQQISKHKQVGQLKSPVSVPSTHHHQLEIRKETISLLPAVSRDSFSGNCNALVGPIDYSHQELANLPSPSAPFSQANDPFLPQFVSNDETNAHHVAVGNLLQEQLMALAKQVSPQDLASTLLIAEIESLKSQISTQQQAQSRNFLTSLPNLVPNLQCYAPCPGKVEEMDEAFVASALITSWILRTCPNIAL